MSFILQAEHLKKYFKTPKGILHAVDDISFSMKKGKTLGVVGESGCGKSTLGRTVLRLIDPTDGAIIFNGENITNIQGKELKHLRSQMQMIFQDPFSSLDPRKTVSEIIEEPLWVFGRLSRTERKEKVRHLMDVVGLAERLADSYPHELDGGRRQRIGIARAIALDPSLIVCDEPVSALDVSIQAQILNLMQDLQKEKQLTYMFITHDMSVVRHMSDDILVMYLGQAVEECPSEMIFENQLHPYTQALLSAVPVPSPDHQRKRILLRGEVSSPIDPPDGCRFAARCIYSDELCHKENPALRELLPQHFVACHKAERFLKD